MKISKEGMAGTFVISNAYMAKLSRDIMLPALPAIAIALNTSSTYVQYSLAIYYFGLAISRIVFTPLSDIFGRRPIVLLSLPIFILGSLLSIFAEDIYLFIFSRLLQALGLGCMTSIGRAMVNDVFPERKTTRTLAFLSAAAVWAPAIATFIGGHLQVWFGWRADFVFLTVCGVLLLLECLVVLRETKKGAVKRERIGKQIFLQYFTLLNNKAFNRYLFSFIFIASGTVVYFTASPFLFVHQLGVPVNVYGSYAFVTVIGMLAGRLMAGFLSEKWATDAVLLLGVCFGLAGGLLMLALALLFPLSVVNVLLPTAVYFCGMGLMAPTSKAATMAILPTMAGSASALLGMMQGLSSTVTSMIIAHVHERDAIPMSMLLIALALLGLIVFWKTRAC